MRGRLLTTREVAGLLGVSPRTVQQMLADGQLAGVKIRRARRFEPEEIEALIAARRKNTTPPPPERPITEGQLRAFHAKAADVDRRLGLDRGASKRAAVEACTLLLGRRVESVSDLSAAEASRLLDWLEQRSERAWAGVAG